MKTILTIIFIAIDIFILYQIYCWNNHYSHRQYEQDLEDDLNR